MLAMNKEFERDLFILIHDVARLSRVEADRRARRMGMTRAQWGIIRRLASAPGRSQKELADLLEVEPITVARMVDRLEAAGMVERRADEQDRRIWRLHLLPAAMDLLKDINQELGALADFSGTGLTLAQREVMVDGLLRIKANLLSMDSGPAALLLRPAGVPGGNATSDAAE
ncbi:MarR family winged helix-turn-helix transcriptional regulator [Acidocella sp.]|uniref:MarR family winged helix-turn-helix transcriptional regulator n=1 Tax=Acidocella sp. TaxID=50710 RepID=UPI0026347B88|nr:MarR family transcriptional regulator [Acidocella sp.]